MKRLLLLAFTITAFFCSFAQKAMLFDKTDPFTHERTIFYGTMPLNEFASAGVSVKVKDTVRTNSITFVIPYVYSSTESNDTIAKECKIKTVDGQIIPGTWISTTTADVVGKKYTTFGYSLGAADFKRLGEIDITDIKMNQNTYSVSPKNRDKLRLMIQKIYGKL